MKNLDEQDNMDDIKEDFLDKVFNLINVGNELINMNKFLEGVENYSQAITMLKSKGGFEREVEKIEKLLEDTYLRYDLYLQSVERRADEEEKIQFEKKESLAKFETQKKKEEEISSQAYDHLGEGSELVSSNKFEQGLENYKSAIKFFRELNWESEVSRVLQLIKELNQKKTAYLKKYQKQLKDEKTKTQELKAEETYIEKQQEMRESFEERKKSKIESFRERKKKEESLSAEAYDLLGEASELEKFNQFEEALENYNLAIDIFKEIGWNSEISKIQLIVSRVKAKQKNYLKKVEKQRQIENEAEIQHEKMESYEAKSEEKQKKEQELRREKIKDMELKKQSEEEVINKITEMINNADLIAKNYEFALKKGKFDLDCPYEDIISIYQEAKDMLKEIGWDQEALKYNTSIAHYEQKLAQDIKLRELEHKKHKDTLIYEQSSGDLEEKRAAIKRITEFEQKKKDNQKIEANIDQKIDLAENMGRKYEIALRKRDFSVECPYEEIIDIYGKIIEILKEAGWNDQIQPYRETIKLYEKKLEKDLKLREIEKHKVEEGAEISTNDESGKKRAIKDKVFEFEQKKKEQERIQIEIDKLIDKAENMARRYESKLKLMDFSMDCPYNIIIGIYEEIISTLKEVGWGDQLNIYRSTIKRYEERLQKDIKLRELESKKHGLAESKSTSSTLAKEREKKLSERDTKIFQYEEKKREEERIQKDIDDMIDNAENAARNYELALKQKDFSLECPFEKIIKIYKDIIKILKDVGWQDQIKIYRETITKYDKKLQNDIKLRELEHEKHAKLGKVKIKPKESIKEKVSMELKIMEYEKGKKAEEHLQKEVDDMIMEAEKMARDYDLALKQKDFSIECPFEEIIDIYRNAKEKLKAVGWEGQAETLTKSIAFYKKKLEQDNRLREFEYLKISESEKEKADVQYSVKSQKAKMDKKKALRLQQLIAEGEESKNVELLKDQGFKLMERAKINLKDKKFDEVIDLYEESKQIFKDIGFSDGISLVANSILSVKQEKATFEKRMRKLKEAESDKIAEERELEQKYLESMEGEKVKRKEMLEKVSEAKVKEKKMAEKAFNLIDEATNLVSSEKFDAAEEMYIDAKVIFKELNWDNEVIKIEKEHLFYLKKKQKEVEERTARLKKLREEKKQMEDFIAEAEIVQSKIEKSASSQQRKRFLEKQQKELRLKTQEEKAYQKLDQANDLIKTKKYNSASRILRKIKEDFISSGWDNEARKVALKIKEIENQCNIPLIPEEEIEDVAIAKKVQKAYELLDDAERASQRAQYMRVVSLLAEVKGIFEIVKWQKAMKTIEEHIELNKKYVKEKREKKGELKVEEELTSDEVSNLAYDFMDKCKKAERRNAYSKAIEFAKEAHKLFKELGKDWDREASRVYQYLLQLEQISKERRAFVERAKEEKIKVEDEETTRQEGLQERLEQRKKKREDLRKRLQNLKGNE